MTTGVATRTQGSGALPAWPAVLAVVAHPDDESFGLGAVLDLFARSGTAASVLCLTHGEASTVQGAGGDLAARRAAELEAAAATLGLAWAALRDYPDGALPGSVPETLAVEVVAAARTSRASGLLVFDPSGVTGHGDHAAATAAALEAAATLGLPALGWTLPSTVVDRLNAEFGAAFTGHRSEEIDLVLRVDRDRQRRACRAHASQAVPTSVLWRRLELLGDREHLRWLRPKLPT